MKIKNIKLSKIATALMLTLTLANFANSEVKNVILIIGDGMGRGAYDLTSLTKHGTTGKLFMQSMPVAGLVHTRSLNNSVTESAAAATAYATGEKTNNSMVAMRPDGSHMKAITYIARENGKAVGVITTDALNGGTPGPFFANQAHRNMKDEIIEDMLRCGFDVLVGSRGTRPFLTNHFEKIEMNGYYLADNETDMFEKNTDKKLLGLVSDRFITADEQILAKWTTGSIARLGAASTEGFLLVIESSVTDGAGHNNDAKMTVMGTMHADNATRAAVEFASTRSDTLVVVTTDHETGGLHAVMSGAPGAKPVHFYTTGNHTPDPVPIYAYGPGSETFAGVMDNTEVFHKIMALWGLAK